MDRNLHAASNQWATRPADQRFWTLKEMYLEALFSHSNSTDRVVRIDRIGVDIKGDQLVLNTPHDGQLDFTHWSFGQFCRNLPSPAPAADYIRSLPADLAKQNIDHALSRAAKVYKDKPDFQLYFNGADREALALTRKYGRAPNHEVLKKLMDLDGNWRPPPGRSVSHDDPQARPATAEDVACATLVQEGEMIGPSGLYLSPEDMFAFLVDGNARINDGTDGGLARGFFVSNSEVGKKGFSLTSFLYRYTCGNHIVWGAQDVNVFRRKHIGDAKTTMRDIFAGMDKALREFTQSSAAKDEALIVEAKKEIWNGLDDLTEMVFGDKGWLTKRQTEGAFRLAEQYAGTDGSPRSAWGFANGVTRLSQLTPYADERTALDTAAGNILRKLVTV